MKVPTIQKITQGSDTYDTYFLKNDADFFNHTRNEEYLTAEFAAAYGADKRTIYTESQATKRGLEDKYLAVYKKKG